MNAIQKYKLYKRMMNTGPVTSNRNGAVESDLFRRAAAVMAPELVYDNVTKTGIVSIKPIAIALNMKVKSR